MTEKENPMLAGMRIRDKSNKPELQAGKRSVVSDLMYRYNLWVNKYDMSDYIRLCRNRGTSASKELGKFITRELTRLESDL